MSFETLFSFLLQYRQVVYIALVIIPVTVFAMSLFHGVYDGREPPWRHLYALVVHIVTALVTTVGAILIYHILEKGSSIITPREMIFSGAFLLSWLLLLAVVKRAVDFSMLRSIRNPFGLLLSWIIAWAAAWFLDSYGLVVLPVARPLLMGASAIVVFVFLRIFLSLLARFRS